MSISIDLVKQHINTICASQDFKSKPRMQELLRYIVTEFSEGRSDQIKGYSIGVDVFKQGENFDPDHNALVRINVGRLRRLLKFYYLEQGVNDAILIEIPKGRYIPSITERKVKEQQLPKKERIVKSGGLGKIQVLVHPLNNVNGGSELEFLVHGFSHELGTALSKFEEINVLRYSNFDGQQKTLDQLLDNSSDIEFVIEGELSAFRNKAQLKIRLIDAMDKSQLWGDSFTLDLDNDNLFETQDKLANKIAANVGAEYGHINNSRMAEVEEIKNVTLNEQKALLQYYYYQTSLSEEAHNSMYQTLVKSIEANPNSALLQALMANVYGLSYALDYPGAEQAYAQFGELAENAFKKDNQNHLIRAILAFKSFMYNEQSRFFNLADEGLKRAPTSPIKLGTYGLFLCLYGEWEKGIQVISLIKENNLDFPKWLYAASCLYHFKDGDYEAALKEANLYQIQNFFWGPLLRTACLGQLGKLEEAAIHLKTLCEWKPDISDKAEYLVSRYIKEKALVSDVLKGLKMAGLEIE